MADGSAFHANRPQVRAFHCADCKAVIPLSELNDDMRCIHCGGADEDDDEDAIDTSVAAMRSAYGTWSV